MTFVYEELEDFMDDYNYYDDLGAYDFAEVESRILVNEDPYDEDAYWRYGWDYDNYAEAWEDPEEKYDWCSSSMTFSGERGSTSPHSPCNFKISDTYSPYKEWRRWKNKLKRFKRAHEDDRWFLSEEVKRQKRRRCNKRKSIRKNWLEYFHEERCEESAL